MRLQFVVISRPDTKSYTDGVPRFLVDKISRQEQDDLHSAIDKSSVIIISQTLQSLVVHPSVSHKLLHTIADPKTCERTRIDWASLWVQQQVVLRACVRENPAVRLFIKSARGISEIAGYRGTVFEAFCHSLVMKGGKLRVRDLETNLVSRKDFPCRLGNLEVFKCLAEVARKDDNVYSRPLSKNLAAVDAIVQPNILLQMTVAQRHEVDAYGLLQALDVLKDPKGACLYFVVPPEDFGGYPKQALKNVRKVMPVHLPLLNAVKQCALELKL